VATAWSVVLADIFFVGGGSMAYSSIYCLFYREVSFILYNRRRLD